MSSAPGPSETKDHERRKSLGKYVKRMSSVFRKDKSAKSPPASPTSDAPAASVLHVQKEEPENEAATTTTAPEPSPAAAPEAKATTASKVAETPSQPGAHQLNRAAIQQERARALFAQYGLTLESHEWISMTTPPVYAQRVERPIRMRVHRTCHHCGTQYGANKVCLKCEHKRCKKCPRYPKRRTAGEKEQREKDKEAQGGVTAEAVQKTKKLLAMTTKGGDERIYRPVKQRVRRSCHECQTLFVPPSAPVCANCQHVRCTKCPRDPSKLEKWPHGYPGDAPAGSDSEAERPVEARRIWRKPRMRVRWRCEGCSSFFIEGKPRCPGCGHERCEKCTREPMKKAHKEPQFDPEVLRAVEEKLRALEVDPDHTSDPETV